jgi:hypothetical protein
VKGWQALLASASLRKDIRGHIDAHLNSINLRVASSKRVLRTYVDVCSHMSTYALKTRYGGRQTLEQLASVLLLSLSLSPSLPLALARAPPAHSLLPAPAASYLTTHDTHALRAPRRECVIYIYIYIYMYVYVYVCVYVYVYVYVSVSVYVYIPAPGTRYLRTYDTHAQSAQKRMHNLCLYIYVCMYLHMHIHICIYIYISTHTYVCVCV